MGKGSRKAVKAKSEPAVPVEPERKSDPRKVSVYLPLPILGEIQAEADRQERSLSWIVQKAWRMAREEIKKLAI